MVPPASSLLSIMEKTVAPDPLIMVRLTPPAYLTWFHAGCNVQDNSTEGSVRLRGGFGTPCDPLHSGFIEVLHNDEWGSICTQSIREDRGENNLVADVVCRQLGFPYGNRVDPLDSEGMEVAEQPLGRFWLSSVRCRGPEDRLTGCDLGQGFLEDDSLSDDSLLDYGGCSDGDHRVTVACRQFPVVEALEAVRTPGAGVHCTLPSA